MEIYIFLISCSDYFIVHNPDYRLNSTSRLCFYVHIGPSHSVDPVPVAMRKSPLLKTFMLYK